MAGYGPGGADLLIKHFDPEDIPNIALACFKSLCTSGVLVGAGIYLGRAGIMNRDVTRGIAELTLRVTMPCLLFTRVMAAMDLELLELAYPMMLLPILYVGMGLVLGQLVLAVCDPPAQQRSTILCAIAFGNPLSMPLMLLAVIQDEMFNPEVSARLGPIADPIVYLSLYQPLAYLAMYAIGGWLMGVEYGEDAPKKIKSMYIIPQSPRNTGSSISRTFSDAANLGAQWMRSGLPSPAQLPAPPSPLLAPQAQRSHEHDIPEDGLPPPAESTTSLCANVRQLLKQAMSPPVVAVLLGMACGIVRPVKAMLWPVETALLGAFVKGMVRLAGAALPVSMLLLGVSICKGPDWNAVRPATNVAVMVAKMVLMPLMATGVLALYVHKCDRTSWCWAGGGFSDQTRPSHVPIFLTALCVSAMPTGNTIVMLVELGGGDRQSLSTLIFLQYVASPLLITISLSGAIIAATAGIV